MISSLLLHHPPPAISLVFPSKPTIRRFSTMLSHLALAALALSPAALAAPVKRQDGGNFGVSDPNILVVQFAAFLEGQSTPLVSDEAVRILTMLDVSLQLLRAPTTLRVSPPSTPRRLRPVASRPTSLPPSSPS